MKNLPELINDPELYAELVRAYEMVKYLRPKVLYRIALLNRSDTIIEDQFIWNRKIPGCLIDAQSKFIDTATWII